MKILITGFDPFNKEDTNPSYEAIKLLPSRILNTEIIKLEIPTVFKESIEILEQAIIENKPSIVICVGQAGGRFHITPEKVALNLKDGSIPDNNGIQPIDEKIFEDGENAYFSNLPVKAIVENLKRENIPASLSYSAGTYVCNNLMYGLLYLINTRKEFKNIKGGFIHVPFSTEQIIGKGNIPSLTLEQISKALEIVIKTSITDNDDIKSIGGVTH